MVQGGRDSCQALVRGLDGRSHLITVKTAAGGTCARVGDVADAVLALPTLRGLHLGGALRLAPLRASLISRARRRCCPAIPHPDFYLLWWLLCACGEARCAPRGLGGADWDAACGSEESRSPFGGEGSHDARSFPFGWSARWRIHLRAAA